MALNPTRIIIHHSATRDSGTVSWGAIRYYHTKILGWKDVGYHCGIELVKSGSHAYYEALFGRDWNVSGAHTRGENRDSLGICFVGNYDLIKPTDEMLIVGAKVVKLWMRLYDIDIDKIYTHHHFADYKSCPGELFDITRLKQFVASK